MLARTLATALACAALAAAAQGNPLDRFAPLSPPDCAGAGNIIAEAAAAPRNATFMRVQHIGDPGTAELEGEVANAVTWNVGELSGLEAPAMSQRGYRDEGLPAGTSAFQLHCGDAGFLINTWQFGHRSPLVGEGPSVSIGRELDPAPAVFARGDSMQLSGWFAIPWILNQAPVVAEGTAQLSFFYYVHDPARGTVFAHVIGLYDNRAAGVGGSGQEYVGSDGVTAFVSSPLAETDSRGNEVRFVRRAPSSASMAFEAPFRERRFFAAVVSAGAFRAMLERLREEMPGISTRPEDYRLLFFGVLGEVFPGTGDENNVSFAASVVDLTLSRLPLRRAIVQRPGAGPLP